MAIELCQGEQSVSKGDYTDWAVMKHLVPSPPFHAKEIYFVPLNPKSKHNSDFCSTADKR